MLNRNTYLKCKILFIFDSSKICKMIHSSIFLHFIRVFSRGMISDAQIPKVESLAPNLPISSEHIAPFPQPPVTSVIPGEYSSIYGPTFPGVWNEDKCLLKIVDVCFKNLAQRSFSHYYK